MKVYYADCDEFDNHRTGYYATEGEAIAAFFEENLFTSGELARVNVYVRSADSDDPDVIEQARYLAKNGSPSPALN